MFLSLLNITLWMIAYKYGILAYHDAFNKEFYTMKFPRSEHVNTIKMSGNMNNNKNERFNGEVRDREKVMCSLKIKTTPILT